MTLDQGPNRFHRTVKDVPSPPLFKKRWFSWLLPATGLISLAWFLLRVIPKPSRASYPCQRVAAPLAGGFLVWILGAAASVLAFRKAKQSLRKSRFITAALCIALSVFCLWWSLSMTGSPSEAVFIPSEPVNSPMGIAKGINPGRVVWVYDPNAANWNVSTGNWWDDANTDQAAVKQMNVSRHPKPRREKTDQDAWNCIFRYFNQNHGFGDIGYQPGEKIAVKLNMNQDLKQVWTKNIATPSPQMVYALLDQLIHVAGVPGQNIVLYDASRYIGDPIVNKNPIQSRSQLPEYYLRREPPLRPVRHTSAVSSSCRS